ncbi:MAG: Sporulation related domain protein [Proteobacteria bacterium]|nr:Sporulation related domain protein [Pseudomonadota bacterium]
MLSDAIRNGENTAKARQNLAYSYALNGQWREARIMAEQDLGSEKVGDRMAEWAADIHPDAYRQRVATLLQVIPNDRDPGQPVQLALANSSGAEQLAAEASAAALPATPVATPTYAAYSAPTGVSYELAPIGDAAEPDLAVAAYGAPATAKPNDFETAFKAPAPSGGSLASVAMDAMRFVQEPAVQAAPTRAGAAPAKTGFTSDSAGSTHLVQLGSFLSEQGARRAWGIYVKRYPELANHDMVITEAVVRGKHYWRVSADGYNAGSSKAMCGKVSRSGGDGCFAYAEGRPMPGAINTDRRMALR